MPVVNSKTRSKLKRGILNSGTANLQFKKSKKRIRLTVSTSLNHKWLTVIKQALLLEEDSQLCLLLKCFN